ncbi:MAG: preprotein translocase subunit SecG [Candidatus Buchananbacteria bacterium RBG_13_36_9]|uniref:Protein-export membrane protein SecG n=1 Tax=Candidatus Buchananbacteria bacterium RBG_13_36_9 TaxID=1797530 RepID=A0A1G1XR55_9BACT|nr:MAG: preprotein translocase subunit SecG [Candidatus Buchananbacteria bacterium RBG_13_36_9]
MQLYLFMILTIIQIVVCVLLITAILLQQRGSGLSAAFGGAGTIYRTKRGLEKSLHIFTIILAAIFLAIALINILY